MPGRHQAAARRRLRLRWLAGIAGGAVVGATLLATFASAGAATDPVKATFGVTGVTTSNCAVSTGGSDVYVAPGQELDVTSSLVGLNLLGLLVAPAGLEGTLAIDAGTTHSQNVDVTNKTTALTDLASGDHAFTFTASKLLGLPLGSLVNLSGLLQAGAKLTWTGTIHVTANAAKCGIAVQLPSVSASVSVTGLPPIQVGVPGVKITVPVTIPTSIPSGLGGLGGDKSSAPAAGHTSTAADINNPIPVPARVVPGDNVAAGGGGGDGNVLPLPNLGSSDSSGSNAGSLIGAGHNGSAGAAPQQKSTGKHKTIDLAASPSSSTGEVWVVLAIVAVIALAFVAATYARLYLIKRSS